ncbi:MAG: helix-turn-helix transcriptional regulator [Flavobacteriales bacterium]|nr:helix-turn-helix transcriptional regulator [Flavobacteriales bacterium]
MSDLGLRFKQQRLNHRLTTRELAQKSGVSMRTINGFERGEKNLSINNLIELMRALQLTENLKELIPEVPMFSPLEIMEREKNKPKRVRK